MFYARTRETDLGSLYKLAHALLVISLKLESDDATAVFLHEAFHVGGSEVYVKRGEEGRGEASRVKMTFLAKLERNLMAGVSVMLDPSPELLVHVRHRSELVMLIFDGYM